MTIAEHFNFNLGNALKYLWRAGLKGDAVEDLRKSAWYLAREIARLGGGDEVAKLKARLAEEEARRARYQAVDAAARRFIKAVLNRRDDPTFSPICSDEIEALKREVAESA